MSKLTASTDLDKVKPEELGRYSAIFALGVATILNNGIDFSTNFAGEILSVTFTASDTNTSIAHTLGRVPSGYIPLTLSAAMILYNGTTANTASMLYLRSSAAGSASVLVF